MTLDLCIYWKWPDRLRNLQKSSLLLSAFVLNFIGGSFFTYGNVQPYYVSYIRQRSHPSSLRFTQSTYVYSCQYALFTLGFMIAGFLEKKIGPRLSVLIGGFFVVLGQCLTYFTIKHSFVLLMLTYGAMYSFGVGIIFISSVVCILKWFPKWAGIASGFVISGNGAGTILLHLFQTGYVNPSNETPDDIPYLESKPDEMYFSQPELLIRVPELFLIQGLIFLFLLTFAIIFMVNPSTEFKLRGAKAADLPSNHSIQEQCNQSMIIKPHQLARTTPANDGFNPCQVLIKSNFYLVWIMCAITVTINGVILSLYKTYGLEVVRASDYFLALTGIVGGIATTITQILLGLLSDKLNHKFAFVLTNSCLAVLLFTLYITSFQWEIMYMVWICGIFSCNGGYLILVPVTTVREFGQKHINANYTLVYTSYIAGAILAGFISAYCLDSLEWYGTFLLLGGLSFCQFLLSLLMNEEEYTVFKYKLYNRNLYDYTDKLVFHSL